MKRQDFINKWIGWVSYSDREKLADEMGSDLREIEKKLTEALDVALSELKKTNSTFYCKNRVFVENYHGTHCTFQCAECRKGAPNI